MVIYRLVVCIFLAFFVHALGLYLFYNIPPSPTVAVVGLGVAVYNLVDKMFLTFYVEHLIRLEDER